MFYRRKGVRRLGQFQFLCSKYKSSAFFYNLKATCYTEPPCVRIVNSFRRIELSVPRLCAICWCFGMFDIKSHVYESSVSSSISFSMPMKMPKNRKKWLIHEKRTKKHFWSLHSLIRRRECVKLNVLVQWNKKKALYFVHTFRNTAWHCWNNISSRISQKNKYDKKITRKIDLVSLSTMVFVIIVVVVLQSLNQSISRPIDRN